jgi:hypothetical protein
LVEEPVREGEQVVRAEQVEMEEEEQALEEQAQVAV